jgi:hypothetical protein
MQITPLTNDQEVEFYYHAQINSTGFSKVTIQSYLLPYSEISKKAIRVL